MQNANNLNTSLNNLNAGEAAAIADINRRTTDAQNAYNTGLAGANAQIEADYIKNLLSERDKELSRQLQQRAADLQERQFQESIRQFNENMALQRQQLQPRFSSGSGGGRRTSSGGGRRTSSGRGSSNNEPGFTNTEYSSTKSGSKANSSLSKELNKKAKTNKGWSYYDTGKSTIRGYQVNGTFYYKKGNNWVAL